MKENQRVFVNILDKEYQVACKAEERDELISAASELDERMRAIKSSGAIIGLERMAVMAALNLCHELQLVRKGSKPADTSSLERIAHKLEKALGSTN
ncbi:cell division protein ZapA [Teredinibacter sp. KSP-S5-2]|uniref:cell division protein ZapA n=1 Tax=Teredinibacter sp. KSP-S5-2 TaxID=3034506 RepID=UPI0029344B30|nr:cell division protein ZapA [Teredinibacter sp. KSP-S5-2]WNO08840.1 cell division protein ZapA [Teredinibacter sp. KSP-S5-2]